MQTKTLWTPICDLLGIQYPIVLAGMGIHGRATPPALVAAVSNAGGLGVLGCAGLRPDEIRTAIRETQQQTSRPFGVNLLLPASQAEATPDRAAMRERIRAEYPEHTAFVEALRERFGLPKVETDYSVTTPDFINEQIEVVFEEKVPVFSAALGDPALVTPRAHDAGMKVIGAAGNTRNAERQLKAGVDIVVAQGTEAGGHTGNIATMVLVPQVVDAVAPTPVLAAGGIGDGRGVVAALALGAMGVWVGTAFLASEETAIYEPQQQEILASRSDDFIVTRAYTGKPARDVRNEVIKAWEESNLKPLPMPLQGVLMGDFVAAAEAAERWELTNNPAGQIGGMLTKRRPAAEIFNSMVDEAVRVLEGLETLCARAS